MFAELLTTFQAQRCGGQTIYLGGPALRLFFMASGKEEWAMISWRWWRVSLAIPLAAFVIGIMIQRFAILGFLGSVGFLLWILLTVILDAARAFDCSPLLNRWQDEFYRQRKNKECQTRKR